MEKHPFQLISYGHIHNKDSRYADYHSEANHLSFNGALAGLITTKLQSRSRYVDTAPGEAKIGHTYIQSDKEGVLATVYERDFDRRSDDSKPGIYLRLSSVRDVQQASQLVGIPLRQGEYFKNESIHLQLAEYKYDEGFILVPTKTYEDLSANALAAQMEQHYSFNISHRDLRLDKQEDKSFHYATLQAPFDELIATDYKAIDLGLAKHRSTYLAGAWVADNENNVIGSIKSSHVHQEERKWPMQGIFLELGPTPEHLAAMNGPDLTSLEQIRSGDHHLLLIAAYDMGENGIIPHLAYEKLRKQVLDGRVNDFSGKIRMEYHYKMDPDVRNVQKQPFDDISSAINHLAGVGRKQFEKNLSHVAVFEGNSDHAIITRSLKADSKNNKTGLYNSIEVNDITPQLLQLLAPWVASMSNIDPLSDCIDFRDKIDLKISRRHKSGLQVAGPITASLRR